MKCKICPRNCGADRKNGVGFCRAGEKYKIARAAPHFWEEPCISGKRGSGATFFSGCNLGCVFCQNYEISRGNRGKEVSEDELMRIFDSLIEKGVCNINLVTPTHYADSLARTLEKYKSPVPVVYNSSGYEKTETLKRLEGLIDVYLPDVKYFDPAPAEKYSGAPDYFEYASKAVLEMFRQVGVLKTDKDGLAVKGLLIRHLVLPGNISQAIKVFSWVRENLPAETYVSVMRQYVPAGRAKEFPPVDRRLTSREYSIVRRAILEMGFENCFFQSADSSSEEFIPEFDLEGVDV